MPHKSSSGMMLLFGGAALHPRAFGKARPKLLVFGDKVVSIQKNRVIRYDSYILDRICEALGCSLGDIIEYVKDEDTSSL